MNDKDYIKELFADKLGKHEVKVNPELWNGIASQLGNAGAAGTGAVSGMSLLTKGIIALAIGTAAVVGVVIVLNQGAPETEKEPKSSETPPLVVDANDLLLSKEKEAPENNQNTITENQAYTENLLVDDRIEEQLLTEQNNHVFQPKNPLSVERGVPPFVNLEKDRLSQEDDPIVKVNPVQITEIKSSESEDIEQVEQDVEVIEPSEIAEITLPNIFSPNGDGQNDYLEIGYKHIELSDFSLVVMNQRSELVFQSADPDFKWNGFDRNGMPVASGKYVYYITARDQSGKPINKFSNLTIVR